jgi:glycine oxidase
MIAPGGELDGQDNGVTRFARQAGELWPSFAAELEQASRVPIGYRETTALIVAGTKQSALRLQQQASGNAKWVATGHLLAQEPLLSPAQFGTLRISRDAQ